MLVAYLDSDSSNTVMLWDVVDETRRRRRRRRMKNMLLGSEVDMPRRKRSCCGDAMRRRRRSSERLVRMSRTESEGEWRRTMSGWVYKKSRMRMTTSGVSVKTMMMRRNRLRVGRAEL